MYLFCIGSCNIDTAYHIQAASTTPAQVQVGGSADQADSLHSKYSETGEGTATAPVKRLFTKRFVIIFLCFVAFMLCNMDRVNMSIAVLPMQKEFGWSSATIGIVQSSFFWCALHPNYACAAGCHKLSGGLDSLAQLMRTHEWHNIGCCNS